MQKQLGKNITLVNTIAFIVVILVGAGSIFLAKDILHNVYKSKEISEDIMIVDSIHSDSFQFLLAIHHFLIDPDEAYAERATELLAKMEKDVNDYIAHEEAEKYKERLLEIDLLNKIQNDIKEQKDIFKLFKEYSETGAFDKDTFQGLEEFGYAIEYNIAEINRIHFTKIKQWEEESLEKMWNILILYMIFVLCGGVAIYTGHRSLLKNVVRPLKELSSATIEFSDGIFDKRVSTDSKTEIGLLYRSFNKMAEKLQEHNELLLKFNEELDSKVKERTLELQQANEQLQKTQNALIRTEKIAAVGQIAAGVTHEVKNPLNSLAINAQMLLKELSNKFGTDSSSYESASLIKYEINRINSILEEFVNFAKFPEPKFVENNMNRTINEVADLISESAKNSKVTINLSLRENIPPFKFDAGQFKEVLINLSQNAIKAMKDGGMLEIKSSLKGDNIIINVSDTGEGIPEKNFEKIFSPFFSTKEGGLGLGLSIVQRIVESHGGKINCISQVGKGTAFEILIPVERGQV